MRLRKANQGRRLTLRLLSAAAPIALMLAGGQAFAQEQDSTAVDELVITGSRIRGVEATGSNIVSVGREEIEDTHAATTGDLLRKFPQIVSIGPSATGATAQNAAANVTRSVGLNLRGIGVNATLPLWEGRRFPAAGTQGQLVDISVIPTIALERIEVVADGASAIYGSDAVTGVVNLMLRKRFNGVEVRGRLATASGNYEEGQIGFIMGTGWEGGSAMFAYENAYNEPLIGKDRAWYKQDLTPFGGRDYRTTACNPGTITVPATPGVPSATYAIPAGGATSATPLTAGTRNLCDNLQDAWVIPQQERNSFIGYAEHDITDRFSAFIQGFFSERDLIILGGGGVPGQTLAAQAVPRANPFFVSPNPAANSVTVAFSFIPVWGFDYNPGTSTSHSVTAGVRADLWGDWKGEIAFSDGQSEDEVSRTRNILASAVTAALNDPNPATALNLFGGPNNPATLATIRSGMFVISAETVLSGVEARADGPLFDIPGGTVRAAVGAEYRQEELFSSLVTNPGNVITVVKNTIERDVRSIYGEVSVPLLPTLILSLAGRYEQYAAFGDTTNPKVGLTWDVTDDLKLRASYGTSFRAPSPVEYDTIGGGAGLYGDTALINGVQRIGIGIAGGNANLKPEEATTWSVGFDYQPSWLEGASVSATWFDLDYTNQIVGLRATPGLFTNPLYAQFVNLAPTQAEIAALLAQGLPVNTPINAAAVTFISDGRRQNLGTTIAQGLDFSVDYAFDLGPGELDLGLSGAYFDSFLISIVPGAPLVDTLGTINNPQKLRLRGRTGWRSGAYRAVAFFNHVDSYTNTTLTPNQIVDDYNTIDLSLSYDFGIVNQSGWGKGLRLGLDVQNLLDEDPPFVDAATGGYDPQSASPIGRLIAVSLTKRW